MALEHDIEANELLRRILALLEQIAEQLQLRRAESAETQASNGITVKPTTAERRTR